MRVWSCLSHPNVVPLLGYVDDVSGQGLVSPWYPEGDVIKFIKSHPSANRDTICADVASGLEYLHSQNPSIVHGDMKGENILITLDGHACICDFGLSIILDNNPTGFTSSVIGMTLIFSAPELLDCSEKTTESDVYAYGCTCIEILLAKKPHQTIHNQPVGVIVEAIRNGMPPISPEQLEQCNSLLPLHLIKQCWSLEPSDRPRAKHLAEAFGGALVSHVVPETTL
ncbi:kinase-like domain-containing protein [Cantharellus anzutake]|uniref:kinase-like domain-containing protein n=1 Tax=Cantharellus anzutake TaxID=1750568 RepID=UPI001904A188|nr:kinase-like domain-containing protein [Cantharellus anzutake]KAF8335709.1 kinase-like domain-containing protein [Cantharellus anzutake]